MIRETVPGSRILDLYSGSGAIGLEAVSRGAAQALLVERDCRALDRNLEKLGPGREIRVLRMDARAALDLLYREAESFDLVFSDPPYAVPMEAEDFQRIALLLAPGGLFMLQRDSPGRGSPEELMLVPPEGLVLVRRRAYGRNVFFFYAMAASSCEMLRPRDFDRGKGRC